MGTNANRTRVRRAGHLKNASFFAQMLRFFLPVINERRQHACRCRSSVLSFVTMNVMDGAGHPYAR